MKSILQHLLTFGGIYLLIGFFYISFFWVFAIEAFGGWIGPLYTHGMVGFLIWVMVGLFKFVEHDY